MRSVRLFLLIGDPVEGSLSPVMFNAAFYELGLNCMYVAVRVPERLLTDVMGGARAMNISGLNVTIPHKISVMGLLDELDDSAVATGAVNTILNKGGKFVGFNTDGEGALRALEEKIGRTKGKRVVLIGAGGAARAIAYSIAKAGSELTIANRTSRRAKELASAIEKKLGTEVRATSIRRVDLKGALECADILINSTSVGMHPNANRTLVTSDMMHRGLVVYDIVYKPAQTRLLLEAKGARAKAVEGLGMLVHQGALAFEIWTGKRAPIKVMMAAAKREMRRRSI